MRRRYAVLLATLAACGGPRWSLPLPALDRVPLSVAERARDDTWIAGGALGSGGAALLLHDDGAAWHPIAVGSDATLWWVFAPTATSVWAVGERGTVVHWNGAALATEAVPTTATLYGVWGAADDNLWIVGGVPDASGVILHKDGAGWHDLTPAGAAGAFFKVWGARSDAVFICGQLGALWRWDGVALSSQASGVGRAPLFTVAGSAVDDVYAVGGLANAIVLHFDGSAWSRVTDPLLDAAPGLAGVAVDRDGTVFVVGAAGTKLRGRPGAWRDESAAVTRADLHSVSLVGGEVFTVGGNYLAPAGAMRTGVVAHFGGDVPSTIR
jgi:hypothetical protein